MSEVVKNLVDAIKSGDALSTEQAFGDAMAERLAGKIDDLRMSLAQGMFNQTQEPVHQESFSEDEDLALVVENSNDNFDADEIHLSEEEVADLVEKYEGFKKLSGELAAKGAKNPGGLAAWIGRKKYGAAKFQKAAATDKKLG